MEPFRSTKEGLLNTANGYGQYPSSSRSGIDVSVYKAQLDSYQELLPSP